MAQMENKMFPELTPIKERMKHLKVEVDILEGLQLNKVRLSLYSLPQPRTN
jgi:hypothetical protein